MVRNHLKHLYGVLGLTSVRPSAVPSYLLFSTAGHWVGLRCLHIIASFFQHLSRICSLLCRRESQRNVVGVPINTTTASDPDTGVLCFCIKEQVQREEAWIPDINELSPSSWYWWLERRSPWRHSAMAIIMLMSEEVSPRISFQCYEQDSVFWIWLYFQHVFRVLRVNYATLVALSSHFPGSIKPNLQILAI
jgi:hypothetical protein